MEGRESIIKAKKEIAPKVTHTKTTICKSTPFFIRKHHLDDTQMRSVLNYDDQTVKNSHQRTYSYKAQVISCANSKINGNFQTFQHPSNLGSRPQQKHMQEEYYPQKQNKQIHAQIQALKRRIASVQDSKSKQNMRNAEESYIKRQPKIQKSTQLNDYGLQQTKQMIEVRRKLHKQAQKIKNANKDTVMRDIKSASKKKVKQLQLSIRKLKIKNLELEKQRLLQEFRGKNVNMAQTEKNTYKTVEVIKEGNYNVRSILNKPRFKIKHGQNEETDSQFSSFQLQ